MDGLILPKVLGFPEEQAGTTQVCEASPCRNGWMMNDGWGWCCSRHPHMPQFLQRFAFVTRDLATNIFGIRKGYWCFRSAAPGDNVSQFCIFNWSATWMNAMGLWGWRKTKLRYCQWWGRKLKIHGLAWWNLGFELAALTFCLCNTCTVKSRENFSGPRKFCSPGTSWKIFIIDGWDMI